MDSAAPTWRLLESHVDYWSGTTDEPEIAQWSYERGCEYVEQDCRGDLSGRGTSLQGYFGIASEHAFAGQSDRGAYIRFSSSTASDRWHEFVAAGLHTTRIDTCVTALASSDVPTLAYSIRYGGRVSPRLGGAAAKLVFMSDSTSGDTTYVGSAKSIQRGRVYDKGRQQPSNYALGSWRWEVQSRHKLGDAIGRHLASRDNATGWIAAYVAGWFDDRSISVPWSAPGDARLPKIPREVSSDAKRLEWLRTSIAPMLERMQASYSLHDLRKALGLLYSPNEYTRTRLTR